MNRNEYHEALAGLPIKNPTPEAMARMCPHLSPDQAVEAFHAGAGYVACPSLRVHGTHQIVSYRPQMKLQEPNDATVRYPPRLVWSYSYRPPPQPSKRAHSYKYAAEAIKFARDNWGHLLIADTWQSVIHISLRDPSRLQQMFGARWWPSSVTPIYVAVDDPMKGIMTSGEIDRFIKEITLCAGIGDELKGDRPFCREYNCACCGGGLGITQCEGCGRAYDENPFAGNSITPLSAKIVRYLEERGHAFQQDPQIAWDKEAQFYRDAEKRRQD